MNLEIRYILGTELCRCGVGYEVELHLAKPRQYLVVCRTCGITKAWPIDSVSAAVTTKSPDVTADAASAAQVSSVGDWNRAIERAIETVRRIDHSPKGRIRPVEEALRHLLLPDISKGPVSK